MPHDNPIPHGDEIADLVAQFRTMPGALLPVLHAVQRRYGYVLPEAIPVIAHELNLSRAEVHGVATFYHDFRSQSPGRHVIRICQAESCQALGSTSLTEQAKAMLEVEFEGTTADRAFTLEPVYCLGNCARSPSVMVDGEVYGRVTGDRFREILHGVCES